MKVGKKPSVRAVIQFTRRKTLDQEAKKRNGKAKSTYLGTHSTVVSEAMKALTEAEKAEIENIRTEWENKGPPPKARREYVIIWAELCMKANLWKEQQKNLWVAEFTNSAVKCTLNTVRGLQSSAHM